MMKSILYTIGILLCGFSPLRSQEEGARFGVMGGLNLINETADSSDGIETSLGYHFGAVYEIPIYEKIAFQPELVFSVQNSDVFASSSGYAVSLTTKLNYLNIPLMGKYYFWEGLSLQFGPQLGILLSSEVEYELSGLSDSEQALIDFIGGNSNRLDLQEYTNALDLALNMGLAYQLRGGFFFGARYSFGLFNVLDTDTPVLQLIDAFVADEIFGRNSVINFSVGQKF